MKKRRDRRNEPPMIVDEEELSNHLSHGWAFVSVLPSKQILIKRD